MLEERRILTSGYLQLNLVSDQSNAALVQDGNLVAAWGTGLNPSAGSIWVADKGTGVASLYSGDVSGSAFAKNALVVTNPGGSPTGVAFNGTSNFQISSGGAAGPATFLFDGETGQISGWNQNVPPGSSHAIAAASTPSAVYKGVALANDAGANQLYAANFNAGTIDVFNMNFQPVSLGVSAFNDPSIPAGFAPFNVENLGGKLYVSYAKQDSQKQNDVPGVGNGFLDVFNSDGALSKHLIASAPLNSPYGMALAPANFGDWSNDLLVANSGDGLIHAFDPSSGAALGTLTLPGSAPLVIDGLKDLRFGNGQTAGDANKLFFSAAPSGGQHGLFGTLQTAQGTNLAAEGARFGATANQPFSGAVATFTDTDSSLTAVNFTATINWGDGSTASSGSIVALTTSGFDVTGSHSYVHTGTFSVKVTINDSKNNTTTALAQAVVTIPPLLLVGATVTATEGAVFQGTLATLSDTDGNQNPNAYTSTLVWGDGATTSGTLSPNGAGFDVVGSHTYAEEGTDTITVTVADTDGSSASVTSTANIVDAPLVDSGLTITATEGTSFAIPLATFFDTDPKGAIADFSATIAWGDGNSSAGSISSGGAGFTVTGSHSYADEGTFTPTVVIADAGGSTATATITARVADADALAGTAATGTATEGQAVTNALATFSDAYAGNVAGDFNATIQWGDGTTDTGTVAGSSGVFSVNGNHTFADEGSYDVVVVLADDSPGTAAATVSYTLTVADGDVLSATLGSVAPTESLALSGNLATFSDTYSGATAGDFSATINWGDGAIDTGTVSGGSAAVGAVFTVSGGHTYAEEGTFSVAITLVDDSPGTASATAAGMLAVADASLTASGITFAATEGITFSNTAVATFTDADPNGTVGDHSATIEWGDGATSSGTIAVNPNGGFLVEGTHAYPEGGTYTATVTISDVGASASASSTSDVADWPLSAAGTTISGTEGTQFNGTVATFTDSDPDGGSIGECTATIDWGDGRTSGGTVTGSAGSYTVSGTHTFADESSGMTITIVDAGGATATATTTADMADADVLSAISLLTLTASEGTTLDGAVAAFADRYSGNTSADFTAQIVWGDGSTTNGSVSGLGADYTVSGSHRYTEEGTYSAQATLSDDDGGNSAQAFFIVVASDPAVVATGGATFTAAEGALSITQTVATFTDPGGPEATADYAATIDWGDGSTSSGTISFDAATATFGVSANHLYSAEGSDAITVTIDHEASATVNVASTASVADPAVAATGGYAFAAVEGETATAQTVATFTDPGGRESTADYSATIKWGDGSSSAGSINYDSSSQVFSVSSGHLYAQEGADAISVTIGHDAATAITVTSSASVNDPAVTATGAFTFTAVEGATAAPQTVAIFTDPAGAEATANYSATVAWGDGSSSAGTIAFDATTGIFTVSGSHLYSDELAGTAPISVTIAHGTASDSTVDSTGNIADPPVDAVVVAFSAVEGKSTSVNVATFTDPGGAEAADKYSATIGWGDGDASAGTIVANSATGTFTVTGDHAYTEEGPYTLSVTIQHALAPNATVTPTATVLGQAVVVTGGVKLTATEGITTASTTLATFTDPDGSEAVGNYAATINWGDGSTTAGNVAVTSASTFAVSSEHLYSEEGSYILTVSVSHDGFDAAATNTASVADPSVAATGGYTFTAMEGAPATAQTLATFTDPGGDEAANEYAATVDWGDGEASAGTITFNSATGVFAVAAAHVFAEEDGVGPIEITIHHGSAADVSVASKASIADPPVSVTPVAGTTVIGGSNVAVATFTDPGGSEPPSRYSATIVWGVGSTDAGTVAFNAATQVFTVSDLAPRDLDGSRSGPLVTIAHEGAPDVSITSSITVSEPPIVMSPTVVLGREFIALANVTVATFTHLGNDSAGGFTASIDWGDGTTSSGSVEAPSYSTVGSHTYGDEGSYTVRVTVSEEGVSATIASTVTIGQELLPINDPAHPTPNQLYVAEVYTDVLLRRVDAAGLLYWSRQLDAGAPRDVVAGQLTHSAEYYSNIIIQPAYEKYLGRAADASGLAFWVAQMQQGLTDEELEAGFIGSDEFFNHAGGTDKLWVDALYVDLLGRLPDAQGEAYWVAKLVAGASRASVAFGFTDSAEREAERITADYLQFLDRLPSPTEVDAWLNEFEQGVTNEDVITGFAASDEYYRRVQAIGP
jgi:uncharacterized protein (TIGR03118 family)